MPPDPPPKIDYSRLYFPSDSVTIGRLRAANPQFLDADQPRFEDGVGMLTAERSLARLAFLKAAGQPIPPDDPFLGDRRGWVDALTVDYRTYGLAAGPKSALQLIKSFESEAAAQAREHLRGGR